MRPQHGQSRRRRSAAAFTLIDLMIVVVILGILAGIAYPLVSHYLGHARAALAESRLAAAQKAVAAHYSRHGSYPPELSADLFLHDEALEMPDGYALSYDASTGVVTLVEP